MSRTTHPPGSLAARFPTNTYVQTLLHAACRLRVRLARSTVPGQWLYRPDERTLYVWEPDLEGESLSFLVVILAHELGHVLDFDERPEFRQTIRNLHWSQVPQEIERSAFIRGFRILEALEIPFSMEAYLQMIEEPVAGQVGAALRAGQGAALPRSFILEETDEPLPRCSCG